MKYADKIEQLNEEIFNKICELTDKFGVQSEFSQNKVLRIPKDKQFGVNSSYVVEVNESEFIDSNGLRYNHNYLRLEQRCEILDAIIETLPLCITDLDILNDFLLNDAMTTNSLDEAIRGFICDKIDAENGTTFEFKEDGDKLGFIVDIIFENEVVDSETFWKEDFQED